MNFFKKLFAKNTPPPSLQKEFQEQTPYVLDEKYDHITPLIQAHKSVEFFNHSLTVDWALSLLKAGNETPNVLMLASFGEPIDAFEIRPYIVAVLTDLGLHELEGDAAVIAVIRYYAIEILLGNALRENLRLLSKLYMQYYEESFEINAFYLLECAWDELKKGYDTYYYDGATMENIEALIKKEAANWLATHPPINKH